MCDSQEKAVQISSETTVSSQAPDTHGHQAVLGTASAAAPGKVKNTPCKDGYTLLSLERATAEDKKKSFKNEYISDSRIPAQDSSNPVSRDGSSTLPAQCPSPPLSRRKWKPHGLAREGIDQLIWSYPTHLPARNFPNCSLQSRSQKSKALLLGCDFSLQEAFPSKTFLLKISSFQFAAPPVSPACVHLWTTLMKQINTKKELQFRNKLVYFPFILYQNPSTCQRKSESLWNLLF